MFEVYTILIALTLPPVLAILVGIVCWCKELGEKINKYKEGK